VLSNNWVNRVFRVIIGVLQGVANFAILEIFNFLIDKVVEWENHPNESDMNKSADLKKVAFFLVTSYFAIFTLLFGDAKFETLAAQYSSILVTTVAIQVLSVNNNTYIQFSLKPLQLTLINRSIFTLL
jgi:Calcium-activated chloride channel